MNSTTTAAIANAPDWITGRQSNQLVEGEHMRYVVILLPGILLGGCHLFLGAPRAKSMQGQAVQPPAQGGNPPGVVIALEQSFIDAVLAATFSGLGTPTFQLGQNRDGGAHRAGALPGWLHKLDHASA